MAEEHRKPTISELLNLKGLGDPPVSPFGKPFENVQISPDGKRVAYLVRELDWEHDRFVSQIWIAEINTGECSQLTHEPAEVQGHRWSPDGDRLAFMSKMKAGGTDIADTQVWLISASGGEAQPLTQSETDAIDFRWSPDGSRIAFHAPAPESEALKERREKYGDFEIVDFDVPRNLLWIVHVGSKRTEPAVVELELSVNSYDWSPDGERMVLELAADARFKSRSTEDIYLLDLADKTVRPLVVQPGPDTNPKWSPEGDRIAFNTTMGLDDFYCGNRRIGVVSADGGDPVSVTDELDETAILRCWGADGIYFEAFQRTALYLFRVDPENGKITRISAPDGSIGAGFSFAEDFKTVAFVAQDAQSLPEIFVSLVADFSPDKITKMNGQIEAFAFGTRELIHWTSEDGTEIEGVLYKPVDFDLRRKHPLLVIIHGGPTNVARPILDPIYYVYPVEYWLAKGAVILKPNYRGSVGYGEAFRSLGVRNLGRGEMWDVISGLDYLIEQGFVDPDRVGAMGASWGGYVSAFLATHTGRFKAVSVGAGIADMVTQYGNTDIPCHPRRYLEATPWDDPVIYAAASPMTAIRSAKTPVLIQHGENDRRVPIPNAHELRQGLEDQGVPVRMIVYRDCGHSFAEKPKQLLAATQHNLEWFDRWMWGQG